MVVVTVGAKAPVDGGRMLRWCVGTGGYSQKGPHLLQGNGFATMIRAA
jgi:hypothetical protein